MAHFGFQWPILVFSGPFWFSVAHLVFSGPFGFAEMAVRFSVAHFVWIGKADNCCFFFLQWLGLTLSFSAGADVSLPVAGSFTFDYAYHPPPPPPPPPLDVPCRASQPPHSPSGPLTRPPIALLLWSLPYAHTSKC